MNIASSRAVVEKTWWVGVSGSLVIRVSINRVSIPFLSTIHVGIDYWIVPIVVTAMLIINRRRPIPVVGRTS